MYCKFFWSSRYRKNYAAHAIANELSLNILALNYADIESKFVGDAPKNLVSAFKIAEKEKAMLFFDEADSFLGKRITNVSSSSDQAVNSLRSQMLILLESFNGTVIFATNLHKNYDSAFESRILKHIKFELPDLDMRAKIIKRMIPNKAPIDMNLLTDDYLLELSEILDGFSPREIKNTILDLLISFLYSGDKEISKELVDKVFRTSKEKFDEIKNKTGLSAEAKKKLENTIKDNLDNKNYTVEKLKENSEEESNDD
ncbi:ATP-binding protein [uncultured Brachyspira sp.]|uniref:ATP-binding protein n=1 Tax=uncultured Brachyspira sp. TaxID=221953 RepID=UPI002603E475|nr:ATP-binding protein [uncultured Brachyspira sp.]